MNASIAKTLAAALTEGVRAAGRSWHVRRAWPADLTDPGAGVVCELIGADGRVVGARLPAEPAGLVQVVPDDPALPPLSRLRAEGWTVLAHRLSKRAVLRHAEVPVFRKLAAPKATRRAMVRLDAVQRHLAAARSGGDRGVPIAPNPAHADPAAGILDLDPAPGVALRDLLTDPATGVEQAREAGRVLGSALVAMARIEAGPDDLPGHSLADEATVLARWTAAAARLALVDRVAAQTLDEESAAICRELYAAEGRESAPPAVLTHRDVHDGQALVNGAATPVLIDWDTACWADPCIDPANLLAHLDLLCEQVPEAGDRVAAATAGLWAGLLAGDHPALALPLRLELLRRASAARIAAVHAFRKGASRTVA
ncbi:phosphotransferase [Ammonicoccus fulvus]|uniref:Phosphotransferase n=1 Tax=Ammonicoccus fulvus TaxID=3138240 RepID=A0ABZ3FMV7_9ACTN